MKETNKNKSRKRPLKRRKNLICGEGNIKSFSHI